VTSGVGLNRTHADAANRLTGEWGRYRKTATWAHQPAVPAHSAKPRPLTISSAASAPSDALRVVVFSSTYAAEVIA